MALLGASPGASTAVWIMVHMLENCFHEQLVGHWVPKLKEMIPSYGHDLKTDAALVRAGAQGHGGSAGAAHGLMSSPGTPEQPPLSAESLDVLLRFGAAMLRSGDTAFRVRDAMGLLAGNLGIERLAVHITLGGMTATAQAGGESVTLAREIAPLGIDASRTRRWSSWRGRASPA